MYRTLITRIEAVMSRPLEKNSLFSLQNLLLLISKVYGFGVKVRLALYRAGILKSRKLPCFVISVGNIAVGGTGKTPMTIYIADLLRQMGCNVVVITRGYRGKYERSMGIVCDGQGLCCTTEESGDEAYMIARTLGIPVVVGKDRYAVGMMAIQKFNPQVIVLDDAFQHMGIKRDLDLVLVDAGQPFGNGELLPRGRLREPVSSIRRSHALVLTRSDQIGNQVADQISDPASDRVSNLVSNLAPAWVQAPLSPEFSLSGKIKRKIPIFKTFHVPFISQVVHKADSKNHLHSHAQHHVDYDDWSWIKGKSCLLFSGLANNKTFQKTCRDMGMKIGGYIDFPDHFWYSKADIDRIFTRFMDVGADFMVTTEKDYVKINSRFSMAPLVVVGVKIVFDEASLAPFESFIKTSIAPMFPGGIERK